MSELRERLEQANTRIEALIWIPGAVAAGDIPDVLKEAIVEDLYDADNAQVLSKLPRLKPLMESDADPDEDWIVEALYQADGFLAKLAKPVPTFIGDKGAQAFSWGYYQTKWVHVDDMEELASLAEAFAQEIEDEARAEAA